MKVHQISLQEHFVCFTKQFNKNQVQQRHDNQQTGLTTPKPIVPHILS